MSQLFLLAIAKEQIRVIVIAFLYLDTNNNYYFILEIKSL